MNYKEEIENYKEKIIKQYLIQKKFKLKQKQKLINQLKIIKNQCNNFNGKDKDNSQIRLNRIKVFTLIKGFQ